MSLGVLYVKFCDVIGLWVMMVMSFCSSCVGSFVMFYLYGSLILALVR